MVAENVETCSHAGVSHWASSVSNGMHSTATDTMLVWASCEEVVVMTIFSSTRPARGGSVAAVVERRRLAGRGRAPSGVKMLLALIEDLMPPPSWKAEGHVASPKHEWFWVVAKL